MNEIPKPKMVQVFGIRKGSARSELLYQCPTEQWQDKRIQLNVRKSLAADGVTAVRVIE